MVGTNSFNFTLHLVICSLSSVTCSRIEAQQVIRESTGIDNQGYGTNVTNIKSELKPYPNLSSEVTRNSAFAGGPVSIDCLRCLCLKKSNCLPIGCVFEHGSTACGFFRLTYDFWADCKEHDNSISTDWRMCSNDLLCASKCVQNYMLRYSKKFQCFQNCEGYTREMAGGPNGCNNPNTVGFWKRLQMIPGCKGVH